MEGLVAEAKTVAQPQPPSGSYCNMLPTEETRRPCRANSSWPSLRTGNAGADAPLVTGGTLVLTPFSHTLYALDLTQPGPSINGFIPQPRPDPLRHATGGITPRRGR
jgi:hypothetical protein